MQQLGFPHLILRERKCQLGTPVSLPNLEVERDEERDDVCQQEQRPDEDQLALGRRFEFNEQRVSQKVGREQLHLRKAR